MTPAMSCIHDTSYVMYWKWPSIYKSNTYLIFYVFPFYFSLRLRLSRAALGKSPVATLHKESPQKGGELDPQLRGRCPLARFACLPHVRHVAGVHGGRASPYFMPPTTKRWSLRSASRVRLRPKCSPVRTRYARLRCGFRFRPWHCPTLKAGAERKRGQALMGGTAAKRWGETVHAWCLWSDPRLRLGVGLRSVATPAPHPDDRGRLVPPSGGRRGENARPKAAQGEARSGGFRGAECPHDKATCAKRSVATWGSLVLVHASL